MPRRGSDGADFVVDPADLQSIVDSGSTASRSEVLLSDLSAGSFAALESLERCVEQEFLHAAAHARMICDLHWENMREEQAAHGDAAALHTRVRVLNGSLQATWMKASGPVKMGSKEKRYIARDIPKGTGRDSPKYTKRIYTGLSEWERELVEYTEFHYEKQRERSLILTRLRKSLKKYRQLIEESYEDFR